MADDEAEMYDKIRAVFPVSFGKQSKSQTPIEAIHNTTRHSVSSNTSKPSRISKQLLSLEFQASKTNPEEESTPTMASPSQIVKKALFLPQLLTQFSKPSSCHQDHHCLTHQWSCCLRSRCLKRESFCRL
ncbi:hypothetical protein C1H46_011021 [Malus baccata]|uniref:Uncharacterized protein n=1 Tax=Malus baccata TaxID=106549 RepID=A0A540MYE6_MALBA|nr:hypothetical protein C1H46_011021 [Malus baccata]